MQKEPSSPHLLAVRYCVNEEILSSGIVTVHAGRRRHPVMRGWLAVFRVLLPMAHNSNILGITRLSLHGGRNGKAEKEGAHRGGTPGPSSFSCISCYLINLTVFFFRGAEH